MSQDAASRGGEYVDVWLRAWMGNIIKRKHLYTTLDGNVIGALNRAYQRSEGKRRKTEVKRSSPPPSQLSISAATR